MGVSSHTKLKYNYGHLISHTITVITTTLSSSAASGAEKVRGVRKLQFSDRQLQISDSKISTEKYQKLSHWILMLHV